MRLPDLPRQELNLRPLTGFTHWAIIAINNDMSLCARDACQIPLNKKDTSLFYANNIATIIMWWKKTIVGNIKIYKANIDSYKEGLVKTNS